MDERLTPLAVSVQERIVAAVEEAFFSHEQVKVGEEVRVLLREKLAAAGEDILRLFEERVVDYENRLWRSDRELCRLHKLLDLILKPQVKLRRAVLPPDLQQMSVCKEELPPEQQEWSPSLGQEEPEPPHIKETLAVLSPDLRQLSVCKEEQKWSPSLGQEEPGPPHIKEEEEDLWSSQEAGITKFPFHPVCVKSDEEYNHWYQLNESQTEENREAEPQASTSTEPMKTEADGDDWGISEAAGSFDPASDSEPTCDVKLLPSDSSETETEYSDEDCLETRPVQSGVKSQLAQTGFSSSELKIHERIHIGVRPYHCQQCGQGFTRSGSLKTHQRIHTGERPYKCQQCGKGFRESGDLKVHQRIHTGERPYKCQQCGKGFSRSGALKTHQRIHTGDRPYTCQQCGQGFTRSGSLKIHQRIHTGDRPYTCQQCGKGFSKLGNFKVHQRIHTGERPYKCQQCGKGFRESVFLKTHQRVHTGERPYKCQLCGKGFTESGSLRIHQRIHTGEKPFFCQQCGKSFTWSTQMKTHNCIQPAN